MPVLFKRNSLSSLGGGAVDNTNRTTTTTTTQQGQLQKQIGAKRPQEPTESEKILAHKTHTRSVKLREQQRRKEFQVKVESATKIQRAWRRYRKQKGKNSVVEAMQQLSRDAIHKKRVRTTQEEWEKQIAALTIQLAWRKYYRKKLLHALHPNKRQLQMWDPEIVALKQQALIHYIYNEQIQAPFWHPTLKAPLRPLWLRFVPSPAAVSYNFALDQYLPWISELGNQGQINWPQVEEEINTLQAHCSQQEKLKQQQRSPSQYSEPSSGRSDVMSNDSKRNKRDSQRPKTTVHTTKKADSHSSRNNRTRKS